MRNELKILHSSTLCSKKTVVRQQCLVRRRKLRSPIQNRCPPCSTCPRPLYIDPQVVLGQVLELELIHDNKCIYVFQISSSPNMEADCILSWNLIKWERSDHSATHVFADCTWFTEITESYFSFISCPITLVTGYIRSWFLCADGLHRNAHHFLAQYFHVDTVNFSFEPRKTSDVEETMLPHHNIELANTDDSVIITTALFEAYHNPYRYFL